MRAVPGQRAPGFRHRTLIKVKMHTFGDQHRLDPYQNTLGDICGSGIERSLGACDVALSALYPRQMNKTLRQRSGMSALLRQIERVLQLLPGFVQLVAFDQKRAVRNKDGGGGRHKCG